ncbi:hypothetical protein HYPSUDRAFT_47108 [Hypholoma sublateritium FD-334 SS-4]|uniref:HPP transmembrane region domain-containing protein n=1 Tax=Hypholoma sublateritium (strain FD-334 SS-4) TaxID=945553 RepID=A0A0D2NC94_HYPSF|nr:hypothetical protein HYPSUDRAFT_47108 [Hypholoma sublateritium FD-334 SS-4]
MSTAPPNRLSRLPTYISRWLGYRPTPPAANPPYVIWLWSWIGAFCGISLIQAVFQQSHYFVERGVPSIVASYGASAVLIYGALDAPLAQPRGLFGGHILGSITGICITKLFHHLPTEARFEQLDWLAGSLSCATAIVVMQMTGTMHPPGGATALLAAVDPDVRALGWYFIPVVLLSSTLAISVALITNNIQRKYPVYWIQPPAPPAAPAAPAVAPPPALVHKPDSTSTAVNTPDNRSITNDKTTTPDSASISGTVSDHSPV